MCLYFLTCLYPYRYSHSDDVIVWVWTYLVFHSMSIGAHYHNTTFLIMEWFVGCLVCTDLFLNIPAERVAQAIMFGIRILEVSDFESWPGHQLSSLRLSWFCSVLPRRPRANTQKQAGTVSFHIISVHYSLDNRIMIVNTVRCDSVGGYFTAFTCFIELTIFRRHEISVFRNYYYYI
jgi:hypothetical protein